MSGLGWAELRIRAARGTASGTGLPAGTCAETGTAGYTLDVRSVWLAVTLVVAVTGLTLAARAARRGDEATGFALCAVTGLLILPISWSHHWLLALPALAIATLTAARRRSRPTMAALSLVAVAGWARLIWRVPTSGGHYAELDLTTLQLIAADAYVLAALAALFSAALPRSGNCRPVTAGRVTLRVRGFGPDRFLARDLAAGRAGQIGGGGSGSPVAGAGRAWCAVLGYTPARRQPPSQITSS